MVWFFCNALIYHLCSMFLSHKQHKILVNVNETSETTDRCSMLSFEFQPPSPRIPKIRISGDRPAKPLSSLLNLSLCPKQPRDSTNDHRIIRRLFQSIYRP